MTKTKRITKAAKYAEIFEVTATAKKWGIVQVIALLFFFSSCDSLPTGPGVISNC
jgi:hypothetical protein